MAQQPRPLGIVDECRFRQIDGSFEQSAGSAPPGRTLTIATTDATARCARIDRFVEVSVLPARIRGILRHGASGFYNPAWQILLV